MPRDQSPALLFQGDTAGGGGNAVAPNKANGAAAGGDGSAQEKSGSGGGVGGGGDRGDGDGGADGGGLARRLDRGGGAGELKLAMAGGKAGGADGSAEDGGSDGGAGGAGSESGGPGARRRNLMVPMTVFTRDQAAQDTYNPLLYGCRSVENYERIEFIDEGAYGKVYCALNKTTGEVVALKQVGLAFFVLFISTTP